MITIRSAHKIDAESILNIYAPFILQSATSFEVEVPTVDAFWQRIQKVQNESPWLVCEIDGAIAGYAYASAHRSRQAYQWSREVSVYIHTDFRQMGIARALYEALFGLLKLQGYRNAFAGIVFPNEASVAFHESMGFEKIGIYKGVGYKNGAWQDVGWWSLALDDFEKPPKEIVTLTTVLHPPAGRADLAKAKEILQQAAIKIKT